MRHEKLQLPLFEVILSSHCEGGGSIDNGCDPTRVVEGSGKKPLIQTECNRNKKCDARGATGRGGIEGVGSNQSRLEEGLESSLVWPSGFTEGSGTIKSSGGLIRTLLQK